MNRRKFIVKTTSSALGSIAGSTIVYANNMPSGYVPLLFQDNDPFSKYHKHTEMSLLNDRPLNMEALAHLLDENVTPANKMFIRNNGLIPENIDAKNWKLMIDGESAVKKLDFTVESLKNNFNIYTYQLTLECGGNGRSEFNPPARGNQWTVGAVSCANWTGVRLKDLLNEVGIRNDATYIGYYGSDQHLSKEPGKYPISRGIPIEKALQDETLIAFEMNGQPIPIAHGFPLRLVAGGWPASASGKWINRLSVRNIIHDGAKMGGMSYRVPCNTVAPGSEVVADDMCIIESMPVKSIITSPKTGALITNDLQIEVRGHAWAGELAVQTVEYSIDFGATWHNCNMQSAKNRLAWQNWKATVVFPKKGYYEVWAKATDEQGSSQPMVLPGWNPRGYLNNACHRIAVKAI